MKLNRLPFLALSLAAFLPGLSCRKEPKLQPVDFLTQIKPLLQSRCINCHHSGALFGDLNFESRASAMRPRKEGPVIVPGQPLASRFYIALTLPDPDRKAMPPTGHRIPNPEVELVKRWIEEGAKWPDGPEGAIKPAATEVPGKA